MSYAGHVMDMISRFKGNRAQFKSRRDRYSELRKAYIDAGHIKYKSGKPVHNKITEEQRQRIRQQIIKENRVLIWKRILAFILALALTIMIIYFVVK